LKSGDEYNALLVALFRNGATVHLGKNLNVLAFEGRRDAINAFLSARPIAEVRDYGTDQCQAYAGPEVDG
jgi:hypothetical protein